VWTVAHTDPDRIVFVHRPATGTWRRRETTRPQTVVAGQAAEAREERLKEKLLLLANA
jgi:hypothetical protein